MSSAAGYNVFRHLALLEAQHREPANPRIRHDLNAFVKSFGLHGGVLPIRQYQDYERIHGLFGCYPYAMARALKLQRAVHYLLSSDFMREMAASIRSRTWPIDLDADGSPSRAGVGTPHYAFKTDLACYILTALADRVEMALTRWRGGCRFSTTLVEFTCGRRNLRLRDQVGKYILRKAMTDRTSAMELRKRPFMAPSAETLGLDRGSEQLGRHLDRRAIARAGSRTPSPSASCEGARGCSRPTPTRGVSPRACSRWWRPCTP
jgi:hypothetical protein